jgi:hypothetical protein
MGVRVDRPGGEDLARTVSLDPVLASLGGTETLKVITYLWRGHAMQLRVHPHILSYKRQPDVSTMPHSLFDGRFELNNIESTN